MNDLTQKIEKVFCNTCKTPTNHLLRARYVSRRHAFWNDENESLTWVYRYSLWSCAGCDEATLQWERAMEDTDEEWEDAMTGYFPTRQRDSIQAKIFKNIKPELNQIYMELVTCFNQDCLLSCTIGLRALIEGICVDKGINSGNLEHKINDLHKFLPSLNLIEALHTFRITGNDAAHRLEALSRDDVRATIEVVEDLLNFLYDLDYKASQVKKVARINSAKSGFVH